MQISKDEIIAGYPALAVRTFLRRNRPFTMIAATAAHEFKIDEQSAQRLLQGLETIGLIETAESPVPGSEFAYQITVKGNAFANASAARPIRRSTAELALRQFLDRLERLNASEEYVYRVTSAVVFGSMLSDAERLGDVDIAIELEPKVTDEAEFRRWCDRRRKLATQRGTAFGNMIDWTFWPRKEIFRTLRARSRALSLHEWDQVVRIPKVRYRVLFGDRKRIAGLIRNGKPVEV